MVHCTHALHRGGREKHDFSQRKRGIIDNKIEGNMEKRCFDGNDLIVGISRLKNNLFN